MFLIGVSYKPYCVYPELGVFTNEFFDEGTCGQKEDCWKTKEVPLRTAQLLHPLHQRAPRHQPQRQHPGQCGGDWKMNLAIPVHIKNWDDG